MENQATSVGIPQECLDSYARGYPQYVKYDDGMIPMEQMQPSVGGANWMSQIMASGAHAYSPEMAAAASQQNGGYMVDPTMMAPMAMNSPYSFMVPTTGQMGENGALDNGMLAYQQALRGNFQFYDTNAYGNRAASPQGFSAGYDAMGMYDEPKKATRKILQQEPKIERSKKMFACC